MSSRELIDLADSEAWPAFIAHLATLGVGDINEQILFDMFRAILRMTRDSEDGRASDMRRRGLLMRRSGL